MTKERELVALPPDKPSDKHTVLMTCKEPGCGKKRWIKPQDVWQVKRCRWCQEGKQAVKKAESLKKLKERIETAKPLEGMRYVKRLVVQKFIWTDDSKIAMRTRRIWP